MIEVERLTVRFKRHVVVDDVSLAVASGRSTALWGDNGAGKTTVIRALLGLLPYEGRVEVAGHDVRRAGRLARAAIGYVPQQLALYDELSAVGYLRFMAGLRKAPDTDPEHLLARVGLADHAAKPVGALSGGMRQRLALAGALLGDPPVLVLDEPTASLDATARASFLQLLGDLRGPERTLLLTSHRLDEVVALADDVVVLQDGKVTMARPPRELASALGLGATLRLVVGPAAVDDAVRLLVGLGYEARRNGHGILVRVMPGDRAAPVRALMERGVAVRDLALEEGQWNSASS